MRKKFLYGTMCIALSSMLIGCGSDSGNNSNVSSNTPTTQESSITSDVNTDVDSAISSESNESSTPVEFKDVSSMSFDDAVSYLDTLPESSSSVFEIMEYGNVDDTNHILAEGECIITKYNGNEKIVVVPETINGYKVVGLGPSAFQLSEELTAVKLPSTTRYIKAYAFVGCGKLSIVSGLENVEILEDACFSTGSSLRVKFGDKITEASYSFYTGHGEVYVKRGSLLSDQDRFGQYENDTSIVFQVIIY